ncbi:MAG TPA: glycosyltransferase family 2 protein [Mariniphaga anaerophila]|uniref:Glycosyltransferase family 2 protein n=1 Tax=Mariniphaga anaerophila TaxID=1484053 RepID=A0A831LVT6_9BACT|nr:glycosyltransferase family 2 protein [Mariniphaga anaerophila]
MFIGDKSIKLVTVAIPVYNGARYLESAVQSVINQDYPVSEIIIVDDNSTDNTYETVEKLKIKINRVC